jgi:cold shock CspA family protein
MTTYSAVYINLLNNVANAQIPVLTSANQLPSYSCKLLFIKNDDASTQDVFIGDANVTTSTGFRLKPGQGIAFTCRNSNVFYAVSGNTGATIDLIVMW